MKISRLAVVSAGALALAACTTPEPEPIPEVPAPPIGPGALTGTVAADRDGDGVVDGYYDANGNYYAFQAPPCPEPPPPPPPPEPIGERG